MDNKEPLNRDFVEAFLGLYKNSQVIPRKDDVITGSEPEGIDSYIAEIELTESKIEVGKEYRVISEHLDVLRDHKGVPIQIRLKENLETSNYFITFSDNSGDFFIKLDVRGNERSDLEDINLVGLCENNDIQLNTLAIKLKEDIFKNDTYSPKDLKEAFEKANSAIAQYK